MILWYLIIVIGLHNGSNTVSIPMQSENACMSSAILQIQANVSSIANTDGNNRGNTLAYCINTKTGEILPNKNGKW